jgi:hypothetical protein
MMMPTAMSMTLPRIAKSLNSLMMPMNLSSGDGAGAPDSCRRREQ